MYDQDKSDGKVSILLPGPGKYFLCEIQPPAGWVLQPNTPVCEERTIVNNGSAGVTAMVVPPYSAMWSVVYGNIPNAPALYVGGGTFVIKTVFGSVVGTVTDNDVNDRHKLSGVFFVKLPSAGTFVICQSGAIPGYHMPNPPCHTMTAEYAKVASYGQYVNPEKQVLSQ